MLEVQIEVADADIDGVWAEYKPGVKFLIARAGNSKFLYAVDKYEKPHRKAKNRGTLATEVEIEIQCRAMAEGILLDWTGLKTSTGPLEYTRDAAFKVLRHNVELREYISDFATEQNNYRAEDIDETAKK